MPAVSPARAGRAAHDELGGHPLPAAAGSPGSLSARASACAPMSAIGSRIVVRPGARSPATATSSKPVTVIRPGHRDPGPAQLGEAADRHVVVQRDDRGGVRVLLQDPDRAGPAAVAGERVLDDRYAVGVDAGGPHRLVDAVQAVGDGGQPERAGQDREPAVPERQHVLGDHPPAGGVVGLHGVGAAGGAGRSRRPARPTRCSARSSSRTGASTAGSTNPDPAIRIAPTRLATSVRT